MIKQLVQKQLIPHKNSYRQELDKLILSMNLPKYPNKKGNKQFTTAQRISVVILYIRSGKSLRDFCNEFNNETQWPRYLELKYPITKSSVNRWLREFDLDFIRKILEKTNLGEKPEVVGIDGTGIDTQFKSTYYQKRLNEFGQKPKSNFHKLDIMGNMEGKKKVLDFHFSIKQKADNKIAKRLLKRSKFKDIIYVGDKGYFDFGLYRQAKKQENYFLFPPKDFGGKCKHNNILHKQISENYYKYVDVYHKRNNAEGIISALKRTLLNKIFSRKCSAKKREMAFKIIVYNMKKNIFWVLNYLVRIMNFS